MYLVLEVCGCQIFNFLKYFDALVITRAIIPVRNLQASCDYPLTHEGKAIACTRGSVLGQAVIAKAGWRRRVEGQGVKRD